MDNATPHRAINLRPFTDNLNIVFNVTYSPFLNPIEEFFGLWKYYYCKVNFSNPTNSVAKNICLSVQQIDLAKIPKFYKHTLKYLIASLKGEEIQ